MLGDLSVDPGWDIRIGPGGDDRSRGAVVIVQISTQQAAFTASVLWAVADCADFSLRLWNASGT